MQYYTNRYVSSEAGVQNGRMIRALLVRLQFVQNLPRHLFTVQGQFSTCVKRNNFSKVILKSMRLCGFSSERRFMATVV